MKKGHYNITLQAEFWLEQNVSHQAVLGKLIGSDYAVVVGSRSLDTSRLIIKKVEGLPDPERCPHCHKEIDE